jgi:hypothetical protein
MPGGVIDDRRVDPAVTSRRLPARLLGTSHGLPPGAPSISRK